MSTMQETLANVDAFCSFRPDSTFIPVIDRNGTIPIRSNEWDEPWNRHQEDNRNTLRRLRQYAIPGWYVYAICDREGRNKYATTRGVSSLTNLRHELSWTVMLSKGSITWKDITIARVGTG